MSLTARIAHRVGGFALNLDLDLPGEGITALFGPSGCGKSLSLRCLAGLERPAQANIAWNGTTWQDSRRFVPPHQRRIGYVPQEAVLFPHLDVRGNLDYARRRNPASRLALAEAAALLGIEALLDRRCDALSGGQRQRVAVARALLSDPVLLLLDEPLSALDEAARVGIARDLRRLARELALPMILVSHSAAEVERLADRLLPMRDGRCGAPQTLQQALADPASPLQVEGGPVAVFDTVVRGCSDDGLLEVELGGVAVWLPGEALPVGTSFRLRVAAREVVLSLSPPRESSVLNVLNVTLESLTELDAARIVASCRLPDGQRLFASITRRAAARLALEPGQTLFAQFKAMALPG